MFNQFHGILRQSPRPASQFRYSTPDGQVQPLDKRGIDFSAKPGGFQTAPVCFSIPAQDPVFHFDQLTPPLVFDHLPVDKF
jgi:hypothetical protein